RERGINAAGKTDDHALETILAHVILSAFHERAINALFYTAFGVHFARLKFHMTVDFPCAHQMQAFLEGRFARTNAPVARHCQRTAIEDEAVLTADEIRVDNRQSCFTHA